MALPLERYRLPLCSAVFATLAAPAAAQVTPTETEFFSATPGVSDTITFDRFDSSLGVLTGVSITIDSIRDTELEAAVDPNDLNFSEGAQLSFELDFEFLVGGSLGAGNNTVGPITEMATCFYSEQSGCFASSPGTFDFIDGDLFSIFDPAGAGAFDFTDAGGPTFDLELEVTATPMPQCGVGTAVCDPDTSEWFGEVSVFYEYEIRQAPPGSEVPLPAAAPLLLAGVGLLTAAARRRRRA